MMRRHVSAVLLVRDGFTGLPFISGSAILCRLDGRPVRPVFKEGGYLVLTDLEPGEHTFSLSAGGFQRYDLNLSIAGSGHLEMDVPMRPDARYAYPPDTARLRLELSDGKEVLRGEAFWASWPAPVQLRLAQSVKAGTEGQIRTFCSGSPALLPVPGSFLLLDEKQPELVRLLELREENSVLEGPLTAPHSRGTILSPVMRFIVNEEGCTELAFPRGGDITLFCRGRMKSTGIKPGATELRWTVDGPDAGQNGGGRRTKRKRTPSETEADAE